jgi:hypothetical protein
MDSASTEGVKHAFAAPSRDMTGFAEPQGNAIVDSQIMPVKRDQR